jgi:hypothetical protein
MGNVPMNSPHLTRSWASPTSGKGIEGEKTNSGLVNFLNSGEASPALHLAAFMDNVPRPHLADFDHAIFLRLVSGVSTVLSHTGNNELPFEFKKVYILRDRG